MTLYVVCNRVFSVWLYMECVVEYSLCVTLCVTGLCNGVFSV